MWILNTLSIFQSFPRLLSFDKWIQTYLFLMVLSRKLQCNDSWKVHSSKECFSTVFFCTMFGLDSFLIWQSINWIDFPFACLRSLFQLNELWTYFAGKERIEKVKNSVLVLSFLFVSLNDIKPFCHLVSHIEWHFISNQENEILYSQTFSFVCVLFMHTCLLFLFHKLNCTQRNEL